MVNINTLSFDLLSLLVANISWTPPEDNNAPITRYFLSLRNDIGDFTEVIQDPAVPYLLLHVIPTYTYTIKITATNRVGDSNISDEGVFMGAMDSELSCSSACVCVCVVCVRVCMCVCGQRVVSGPQITFPAYPTFTLCLHAWGERV